MEIFKDRKKKKEMTCICGRYTPPDAEGTALYTVELYYIHTHIIQYTPPTKRLGVVYHKFITYEYIYYITTCIYIIILGRHIVARPCPLDTGL